MACKKDWVSLVTYWGVSAPPVSLCCPTDAHPEGSSCSQMIVNSFKLGLFLDSRPLMVACQDPVSLVPALKTSYLQLSGSVLEKIRPSSKYQKPYPKSGIGEGPGMGSVVLIQFSEKQHTYQENTGIRFRIFNFY